MWWTLNSSLLITGPGKLISHRRLYKSKTLWSDVSNFEDEYSTERNVSCTPCDLMERMLEAVSEAVAAHW